MKKNALPLAVCWFLTLVVLFAGCKCPDANKNYEYTFPAGTTDLVPYLAGQNFAMADSAGHVKPFTVRENTTGLLAFPPCQCCPHETGEQWNVYVNQDTVIDFVQFSSVQYGADDVATTPEMYVTIGKGPTFSLTLENNALHAKAPTTGTLHNSLALGAHTYLNVMEFHRPVTDSSFVEAFWYNTQNGLLQYKTLAGASWTLQ